MAYTTIDNPELFFQTVLWTGSGSARSITLPGSEDMQPDWVWGKNRGNDDNDYLLDSIRGVAQRITTNNTQPEGTSSTLLTAFNSDGFSLGTSAGLNASGVTAVAWCWKAGTAFSNDASATSIGTIDSTGTVNDTAGFSIVAYTGTGSAGTVKHGLSTTPSMILVKSRTGTYGWGMYHHKNTSAPATDYLSINNTDATVDDSVFWNDTAPTSSVFSLGGTDAINKSTNTHIAYCFAEKKGYSKFGSYIGNGSADGTFVHTGFKPAWVMIKQSSGSGTSWNIWDNKRLGYNTKNYQLEANTIVVENTSLERLLITSNGFKCITDNAQINGSGNTYIYMAFAESPFVNSNGVPNNAR